MFVIFLVYVTNRIQLRLIYEAHSSHLYTYNIHLDLILNFNILRSVPEKTHTIRTFISHLLTYLLAPSAQVVQNGCTSRQREQWRTFPFPRTCLRNPRPGSPSLPSWCKQDRKRPPRRAGSRESAGASWQDGLELARFSN